MKKATLTLALAGALTVSAAAPAMAQGRWENQVTGHAVAQGTSIDVSARESGDVVDGMFQVSRGTLSYHGEVTCYYEDPESGDVAISGPINVQEGEGGPYTDGDIYTVLITNDGTRVRAYESDPALADVCGDTGARGVLADEGGFEIR